MNETRSRAIRFAEAVELGEEGFVVQYGNPAGLDIDLLLVAPGATGALIELPPLDINVVSDERLWQLIADLDPRVTEPLLQGTFVRGSQDTYQRARTAVREARATPETGRLHWRIALDLLLSAGRTARQAPDVPGTMGVRESLTHLSFSVYHLTAAREYTSGRREVVSFVEAQDREPLLQKIRTILSQAKRCEPVPANNLLAILDEAEDRFIL